MANVFFILCSSFPKIGFSFELSIKHKRSGIGISAEIISVDVWLEQCVLPHIQLYCWPSLEALLCFPSFVATPMRENATIVPGLETNAAHPHARQSTNRTKTKSIERSEPKVEYFHNCANMIEKKNIKCDNSFCDRKQLKQRTLPKIERKRFLP